VPRIDTHILSNILGDMCHYSYNKINGISLNDIPIAGEIWIDAYLYVRIEAIGPGCYKGDGEVHVDINSGHTAKALVGLLSEKSPIVRQKAAEAMGMLWSY